MSMFGSDLSPPCGADRLSRPFVAGDRRIRTAQAREIDAIDAIRRAPRVSKGPAGNLGPRLFVLPFGADAGARSPACIDAGLQTDVAGDVEIEGNAVVPLPRPRRDADADPVVDRAA